MPNVAPMWKGQHGLDPVEFGMSVDVRDLVLLGKRFGLLADRTVAAVSGEVQKVTYEVGTLAYRNLSGDGHKEHLSHKAYASARLTIGPERAAKHGSRGAMLNVRTNRLRGALVVRASGLRGLIQDDVFYGALWERGGNEQPARPWMGQAVEESGVRNNLGRRLRGAVERAAMEAMR